MQRETLDLREESLLLSELLPLNEKEGVAEEKKKNIYNMVNIFPLLFDSVSWECFIAAS